MENLRNTGFLTLVGQDWLQKSLFSTCSQAANLLAAKLAELVEKVAKTLAKLEPQARA